MNFFENIAKQKNCMAAIYEYGVCWRPLQVDDNRTHHDILKFFIISVRTLAKNTGIFKKTVKNNYYGQKAKGNIKIYEG